MDNLQIFNNAEFGEVRTVIVNNEPMFCLADVCKALDITNYRNVVSRLNEKGVCSMDTLTKGGNQKMNYINESNLYKVIFQSRKESAERFTNWVTDEVLPSIRKTGGYKLPQTYTEALEHLLTTAKENERLMIENNEMKPKALFADAVSSSKSSILIGELAKLLKQNGIDMGQNRLFTYLRDNGYLIKRKGSDWNMPTQRSMEMGLFEIKENTHIDGNGCNITTRTAKVTGRGQVYFINHFLKTA